MRNFNSVAVLVKANRLRAGKSQVEIGKVALNSKNYNACNQFMSNIERGICSIPVKSILSMSKALKTSPHLIISAMTEDYKNSLLESLDDQIKEAKNGITLINVKRDAK